MRLLIVGERSASLAAALPAQGVDVVLPPDAGGTGRDDVEQIAAGLRAFEGLLSADAVGGVALAGSSNSALAALLVATKMQIPVAAIEGPHADGGQNAVSGVNRRLITKLADAILADDAPAVAAWLRGNLNFAR